METNPCWNSSSTENREEIFHTFASKDEIYEIVRHLIQDVYAYDKFLKLTASKLKKDKSVLNEPEKLNRFEKQEII